MPVKPVGGYVVLADGEMTGHAHRIIANAVSGSVDVDGQLYVEVHAEKAEVVHPEHDTLTLPPGAYCVVRQREYEAGSPRRERRIRD